MKNLEKDLKTSTVDGAAAFERAAAKRNQSKQDAYDERFCKEDDEEGESEEWCNCSDPGCPCGGTKKGSL